MDDRVESAVLLSLIGGGLIVCALGAREPSYRKNYGLAFKKFGQLGDVQSNPSRMLHRLPGRSIRTDVADIALPPPISQRSYPAVTHDWRNPPFADRSRPTKLASSALPF